MNARFSSIPDMAVVDLEVSKTRTAVPSENTATRNRFREHLLERDVCCVFTEVPAAGKNGSHIIPYKRGSEVGLPLLYCNSI
jgi:hypothetical protein